MLWLLFAQLAFAFPTWSTETPSDWALLYTQGFMGSWRAGFGLFDGAVTSSPPDSTRADRRLITTAAAMASGAWSKQFGTRISIRSELVRGRIVDELDASAYTDWRSLLLSPAVDLVYVTSSGLEVYIGAERQMLAEEKTEDYSASVSSTTTREAVAIMAPRIGAVRRAGIWQGGFHYIIGQSAGRNFTKAASDGSSVTGSETKHIPSEIGISAAVKAGASDIDFGFRAIQASDGGDKTESGTSVREDYLVAKLGVTWPFAGILALTSKVEHQTLSYAKNGFVSLDTIPQTSFHLGVRAGARGRQASLGVNYSSGRDLQSLPEFNARYEVKSYGVIGSLDFPF